MDWKVEDVKRRKFKADFLRDDLDLPFEAIDYKIVGHGRWTVQYEIVFEFEGKFYLTTYSEGATELQYERPWEFEEEVECIEVEKREVTEIKWMPKI